MGLLRHIVAFIERRTWVKLIALPALSTVPGIILAFAEWNTKVGDAIKGTTGGYMLVVYPFVLAAMLGVYEKLKPPKTHEANDLLILLLVLRKVVGAKVERFTAAWEQFRTATDTKARKVFTTITKPDEQLEEIVGGIYEFFLLTRPADITPHELNLRVSLAAMGDKHIDRFACFYPPDERPRSKIRDLQDEYCGFSRAKEIGAIIVVPDIETESTAGPGRCFVVTDNSRRTEQGSMICYPVRVRGADTIPFVISVCASQKNYFKKADKELYADILAHFEQRIVLEYCLKMLKELAK